MNWSFREMYRFWTRIRWVNWRTDDLPEFKEASVRKSRRIEISWERTRWLRYTGRRIISALRRVLKNRPERNWFATRRTEILVVWSMRLFNRQQDKGKDKTERRVSLVRARAASLLRALRVSGKNKDLLTFGPMDQVQRFFFGLTQCTVPSSTVTKVCFNFL